MVPMKGWGINRIGGLRMKAIVCTRYGPPEVLQLTDVERPTPKQHQVCIRIVATAVTSSARLSPQVLPAI
jgi:Zn-dependent alcohol dehydrogenase